MSERVDVDVVVVGAGPAGAAAATVVARAGRSVLLVDKATFPRDKCCGDGLTTWALRELDALGLDPGQVPSWKVVDRAWMGSPSRRLVELPLPPGPGVFAAVARRAELDAALVDVAAAAGVELRLGSGVVQVPSSGDDGAGVQLELADGSTVVAGWAVAADGMWSPMRKHVGAPGGGADGPYLGEWHAFRQYFTNVSDAASTDLFAWFEPDFLPGYAWSFPLGDGAANVGFGILRGGRWPTSAMKALWPEILARPHIREVLGPDAVAEEPHKAWPIPANVGALPLTHGRVLFVGDAAALADPLTGEGIGQALASGRWAAEAIIDHGFDGGGVDHAASARRSGRHTGGGAGGPGAVYASLVHHHLSADHSMAAGLSRALSHRKGARSAMWLAGLSPWTRRNFARWLFEDYPRALAFTPSRWHRQMFTGPGAYR